MAGAASLAFVPLPSTGRPCGVVARAPGSGAKPEGSRPTHQASVSPSHFAGCCEDCRRWAQRRSRRLAGERVGRSGALIHRWAPGATCCRIQGVAPGWVRVQLGGAHRLPPRPRGRTRDPALGGGPCVPRHVEDPSPPRCDSSTGARPACPCSSWEVTHGTPKRLLGCSGRAPREARGP